MDSTWGFSSDGRRMPPFSLAPRRYQREDSKIGIETLGPHPGPEPAMDLLPRSFVAMMALLGFAFLASGQENDLGRYLELLRDGNTNERGGAATAIGKMGHKGKKAVPYLVKALKDREISVRDRAGQALEKIGEDAVPELIKALKDPDEVTRRRVLAILGGIGPAAKDALPVVFELRSDSDEFVREAAKAAFVRIRADVHTLLKDLRDKDEEIRAGAATSLGILGGEAKSAVPQLSDLLTRDKSRLVRREAAKALGRIGKDAKDAVKPLASALTDADEQLRLCAVVALGEIGPAAQNALPALANAMQKDKSEEFREAASRAAEKIQGKNPKKP